jgi:hypothetical protein
MDLYRSQYREGQLLQSHDLSGQVESEEQLRWWHNRAVHHAYGIAQGLEVVKVKDTTVTVKPGLAYDCFGRPLWVEAEVEIPVPSRSENNSEKVVLFIRCLEAERRDEKSHEDSGCMKRTGADLTRSNSTQLHWKRLRDYSFRDGVAIATLELHPSVKRSILIHEGIHHARPDRRPYVVNATTILGHTAWEEWEEPLSGGMTSWGVQVRVDTSAAGFTGHPVYVAQTAPVLGPFPSYVTNASETGFTFRVAVDQQPGKTTLLESTEGQIWLNMLRRLVAVRWVGLEAMT